MPGQRPLDAPSWKWRIERCVIFIRFIARVLVAKGVFRLLVFHSSEFVKTDLQVSTGRSICAFVDLFLSHFLYHLLLYFNNAPWGKPTSIFVKLLLNQIINSVYAQNWLSRVKTRKKLYMFCRSTIQASWLDRVWRALKKAKSRRLRIFYEIKAKRRHSPGSRRLNPRRRHRHRRRICCGISCRETSETAICFPLAAIFHFG